MSLDLFAVLIKFSLSVEYFIHIRECIMLDLDYFFLLPKAHHYLRTKKHGNNAAALKSAFQLSFKTKGKTIAFCKTLFMDDSQFLLINSNDHL